MRKNSLEILTIAMSNFLEDSDNDGGNPELCYDKLHIDMAKAAAAVYDACMAGQKFEREQRS